ncbi:acyl carrier protein [Streptomyces sp. adm13(2018)]|nr:acyl carrier protein [Streptomyces sp. adm13(2018)]
MPRGRGRRTGAGPSGCCRAGSPGASGWRTTGGAGRRTAGRRRAARSGRGPRTVCRIWAEVLGLPDVGPEDDLFDLGGHSLTVVRIAARIRDALGVEVDFDVFFDVPTPTGVRSDRGSGPGRARSRGARGRRRRPPPGSGRRRRRRSRPPRRARHGSGRRSGPR